MLSRPKRKILTKVLFVIYIIFMGYVYVYYRTKIPSFDFSLLNGSAYLVDTEGYKLPNFDPFHESIRRYIKAPPQGRDVCSKSLRPMTSASSTYRLDDSGNLESAILVHREHRADYGVDSFACCFRSIDAGPSNDHFVINEACQHLCDNITIMNDDAVFVICSSKSAVFYKNVHHFVQRKIPLTTNNKMNQSNNDKLNVLFVGLDSVSRNNMLRYMPKTLAFMQSISAIDLRGYNKVGDNTRPALIATLTGRLLDDPVISQAKNDEIPFLWKDYLSEGYATIYGEDCRNYPTFEDEIYKPVITHYLNPYFKATEAVTGSNGNLWWSGCYLCYGPKFAVETILDYASDVSRMYLYNQPYFSFFWSSSMTHDRLHYTGLADEPVEKFLRQNYDEGLWNNTIVLLMADHGIRFGDIRETYIGTREESLPFAFLLFPDSFKENYPVAYENVMANQFRLTTPLDIYETLIDVLYQRYADEVYLNASEDYIPDKFSLFKPITGKRTCLSAQIPYKYCAGFEATEVSASSEVKLAANAIVESINKGLVKFNDCHQLKVFAINKSYLVQFHESNKPSNLTYYEIQLTTTPGKAILEAIVSSNTSHPTTVDYMKVVGGVSRLNAYGDQSYCIKDFTYVKYCLCKVSRKNSHSLTNEIKN